jgi:hypothetical protein
MPGDTADEQKRKLDRELDLQLEATFPASDAPKITQPHRRKAPESMDPRKQGSRQKDRVRNLRLFDHTHFCASD